MTISLNSTALTWLGAMATLTRRVNTAISPNQVNAVLFKEIVVQ